jgi:tetratricopeptide (TPR) repeat protein
MANNLSDVVGAQLSAGRPDAALATAREAAARRPRDPEVRLVLGALLMQLGNLEAARPEISAARGLDPHSLDAIAMDGTLRAMQGEHTGSEQCFRDALKLAPGHPGLLMNLGHTLKAQGRFPEAVSAYREVMRKQPDATAAVIACADTLSRLDRVAEGLALLESAVALRPDDPELQHALGNLCQDEGLLEQAARHQEAALRLQPDFVDAAFNLGAVEAELGRFDRAAAALRRAVSLNPQSAENQRAYWTALFSAGDVDGTLAALVAAKRATGDVEFDVPRAHLLRDAGRLREAEEIYRSVIRERAGQPDSPLYRKARLDLAITLLLAGRLREGWKEYAARIARSEKAVDPRVIDDPGALFSGALGKPAVFADVDQGIGDQLFFLRFAQAAVLHCSRLAILTDRKLRPLLRRGTQPFAVIDQSAQADDCAVRIWLPDLSLASPDEYAAPLRLSPEPGYVSDVSATLARCGPPPYVGVTWRAGPKPTDMPDGAQRYIKDIEPAVIGRTLAPAAGTVIVLQRGMSPHEGGEFVAGLGRSAFDFSGYADDLERMLALLSLLDEYVTVSNTNVHLLAGLEGGRACVLVPTPAEWRWRTHGSESPWFPGFSVYTEDSHQGWAPILPRLGADLLRRLGACVPGGEASLVPSVPERCWSRSEPSPRYRALVALYRRMHLEGDARYGIGPGDMFPGKSFLPQARRIRAMVVASGARTLLDYGSGKGRQYELRDVELPGIGNVASVRDYLGVDIIRCYDPGYPPHGELPGDLFDGVVATDVLEHCPEEDLEWIVAEMFGHARRFVFASVASYPAGKVLPSGENAHITQRGAKFWQELFDRVGRSHPQIRWEVHVTLAAASSGGFQHKRLAGKATF